jgi:hypothetical protein
MVKLNWIKKYKYNHRTCRLKRHIRTNNLRINNSKFVMISLDFVGQKSGSQIATQDFDQLTVDRSSSSF